MSTRLHTYVIAPMDFGWEGLSTLEEHAARMAAAVGPEGYGADGLAMRLREFWSFAAAAHAAGPSDERRAGKQGETHVMVLPPRGGDCEAWLALIWKLDNNGDTVVVSQVPLAYLDEA